MALSPQEIRDATFRSVKRGGFDPDEVSAFKAAAADALQQAIQDATAMEARARAAVARLQELSQQQAAAEKASAADTEAPAEPAVATRREATVDEAETISRALLLAQRTADTTVAEAEAEAEAKLSSALAEAERLASAARDEATGIIEAAKAESRKAGEVERVRVEGEVQALLARRDFLESDVDQLEQHLSAQRERITDVVAELEALTTRTDRGLAAMRRPQLSASDQDTSGISSEPDGGHASGEIGDDDEPDVAALIDEVVETADSGGDELGEIARVAGADEAEPGPSPRPADDPDNRSLFHPEA